jgi:hypothetical protein
MQFPDTLTFSLTFKAGVERTDCRKKHRPAEDIVFVVAEGYETLKGRIRGAATIAPMINLPQQFEVYFKHKSNATNANYKVLSQNDFINVLTQSWNAAGNAVRSRFKPEIFVYVPKESAVAPGIRRATQARITDAAARIEDYLNSNPTLANQAGGAMAQQYWATNLARQTGQGEEPISIPTNRTFRQLVNLDSGMDQQDDGWVNLRIRFGGGDPIPVQFNRSELRMALMLPTMASNMDALQAHSGIEHNLSDQQHLQQNPYATDRTTSNIDDPTNPSYFICRVEGCTERWVGAELLCAQHVSMPSADPSSRRLDRSDDEFEPLNRSDDEFED